MKNIFREQDRIGTRMPVVEPDFSGLDTPEDMLRDAEAWGFIDRLRELLGLRSADDCNARLRLARDIAYEFAGAKDRALAVDVFLHATGIGEFAHLSLRDYAAAHGCCHEWFRQQVEAMRGRLGLAENFTDGN